MHVKKCTYRHTLHTDIHKNGTRCTHTEQPLSDQGNDKNYAHHTHTHHTPLHSLSYSLLFFFWGGGGGGGAPLLCVRTFSCKCICVCVCVYVNCNNNHQRQSFSPSSNCYDDVDGGFLLSIWAQSNNNKKTLTGTLTSLPASTTTTFFNMASFSLLSSPLVNFISDFWKYAINYAKSAKKHCQLQ